MFFDDPVFVICLVVTLVLGLCFGSFSSALIHRERHGLSWLGLNKVRQRDGAFSRSVRSMCPACHHVLSVWDLLPVVSWLALRGACRYCRAPISLVYPLLELISLGLCLLVFAVYGVTFSSVCVMAVVPFLLALFVIDCERLILPDAMVVAVAVLGGLYQLAVQVGLTGWGWAVVADFAGVLGSGFLYGGFAFALGWGVSWLLKKEALGGGDVKFFAAVGVWLGPLMLPWFCVLSGVFGLIIGGVWRQATGRCVFPFGPALIVAFFLLQLLSHLRPSFFSAFV